MSQTNTIWKAQPLFISSTFSDMMAERSLMLNEIFPELAEELRERQVHLEPIDLRWGVETSGKNEQVEKELLVLKVCLDEIDRSEPFFIGLIGHRYGWVPPAERMKTAEEEKGFKSKLKDKSITALEIEYGVFNDKEQLRRTRFYFREPLPFDEMPASIASDFSDMHNPEIDREFAQKRMDDYKQMIVDKVGKEKVHYYAAGWDKTNNKVTGLDEFKNQVLKHLREELDTQTKELEDTRPKRWQHEERARLAEFIEERALCFAGREDIIKRLKEFVHSPSGYDNCGLCLAAGSGYGKSALFAKLHKELANEKLIVLSHAAGISLRSNSLENMLTIWLEELAHHVHVDLSGQLQEQVKFDDLRKLFIDLLSRAAVNERVVVIVDALNQFERTAHARYMNWLPELLPANVKFIFTAIPGEETAALEKRKGIAVEELKPVTKADAEVIITAICKRYHKEFNNDVREILLNKTTGGNIYAYGNPLWLSMAVDEFLLLDEDDFAEMKGYAGNAEERLKQLLVNTAEAMPPEIEQMYGYLFSKTEDRFGKEFVLGLLSYIGISRNGLRESDLESLIDKYSGAAWDSLKFAAFRRYLRAHIVRKGGEGLWDFRHVQARESLHRTLLNDEGKIIQFHNNLATHLEEIGDNDSLHLTEIMWHLFKCGNISTAPKLYDRTDDPLSSIINAYNSAVTQLLVLETQAELWILNAIRGIFNCQVNHWRVLNNIVSMFHGFGRRTIAINSQLVILIEIKNHLEVLHEINKSIHGPSNFRASEPREERVLSVQLHLALARIYKDTRDYEKAKRAYMQSLERTHLYVDIEMLFGSIINEELGDIYCSEQDIPAAIVCYQNSFDVRNKYLYINANPFSVLMLASISNRIARLHAQRTEVELSRKYHTIAMQKLEKIYIGGEANTEALLELARTYIELSQLELLEGILYSHYESLTSNVNLLKACQLLTPLYENYPESFDVGLLFQTNLFMLAKYANAHKDFKTSSLKINQALDIIDSMKLRVGFHYELMRNEIIVTLEAGVCEGALGNCHTAKKLMIRALSLQKELYSRVSATDYEMIRDTISILFDLADLAAKSGNRGEITDWIEQAISLINKFTVDSSTNEFVLRYVTASYKYIINTLLAIDSLDQAVTCSKNMLKASDFLLLTKSFTEIDMNLRSDCCGILGSLLASTEQLSEGIDYCVESIKYRKMICELHTDSITDAIVLCENYLTLGGIYLDCGDKNNSQETYKEAFIKVTPLMLNNRESEEIRGLFARVSQKIENEETKKAILAYSILQNMANLAYLSSPASEPNTTSEDDYDNGNLMNELLDDKVTTEIWDDNKAEENAIDMDMRSANEYKQIEEAGLDELRATAEKSYSKGNWEAAEVLYKKLLKQNEPIAEILPRLFTCVLNKHEKLLESDTKTLNDLLLQLEAAGEHTTAAKLKEQLTEKLAHPQKEKKGWKFWK